VIAIALILGEWKANVKMESDLGQNFFAKKSRQERKEKLQRKIPEL
jgi:hypothetical protein